MRASVANNGRTVVITLCFKRQTRKGRNLGYIAHYIVHGKMPERDLVTLQMYLASVLIVTTGL